MNEVVTDTDIIGRELIPNVSEIDIQMAEIQMAATMGTEERPPKRQVKVPRDKPSRKRSTSKRNDLAIVETTKKHCNISGMLGMHVCVCTLY